MPEQFTKEHLRTLKKTLNGNLGTLYENEARPADPRKPQGSPKKTEENEARTINQRKLKNVQ